MTQSAETDSLSTKHRMHPIAVVGLGALFPGSTTVDGYWRDIIESRDRLTEVPRSHWLREDYFDPTPGTADKIYATKGGFMPSVDFSPLEFGMPPNAMPSTDTAQLLALVVAKRVLEEATRGKYESVDRSRMSVVLGVASATELVAHMSGRLQRPVWEYAMRQAGLDDEEVARISKVIDGCYVPWQESTFPGLLGNVVAGRITNRLDLGGTNAVVDAACAGSLAAIAMAVNDLALGNSDLVITGGVDALNDILMYMCFAQTGALSVSGDCRPFSDQSDGTMLGEGIGMLALRRLEDAERDGDAIYAVIRGLGSSSDGKAKSIYAPSARGQTLALRRAYERAGYGPETVGLVEAHGTGTVAGDMAEFEALKQVFEEAQTPVGHCALGSVKAQIGHTKAAAGAAGMIKAVLALHQKVLPPTVKVRAPNPKLGIEDSPFYLSTEARPWVHAETYPRRASVSALGFGGTNFHVALEEYTGPSEHPLRVRALPAELLLLSADNPAALAVACRTLATACTTEGALEHVAKRSQAAFNVSAVARVSVVASDEADAREKLAFAAETIEKTAAGGGTSFSSPNGVSYGTGAPDGSVAFLFPGQGSQYVGMGGELAMHFDVMREVLDASTAIVGAASPGDTLATRMYPQPVFSDAARTVQATRLSATEWAQPAIAATSLGMLRLLDGLGMQPSMVAGHSLGEVTAAVAAGMFDAQTGVAVARERGTLMASASETPGTMSAAAADLVTVAGVVAGIDVVLANHNSPKQVVLSGAVPDVERAEKALEAVGIAARRLQVSNAFHSPLVSASVQPFQEYLRGVRASAPHVPFFANATAVVYPTDAAAACSQLAGAIAQPVRFVEQIDAMYAAGARTFIEVGPDSVLSRLTERCLAGRTHLTVPLDQRGKPGVTALFTALGRLAAAGVPFTTDALWQGQRLPEDPATKKPAKFSIELNGANYGKPYPPREPEVRVPRPAAVKAIAAPAPVPLSASAPASTPAPAQAPALTPARSAPQAPVTASTPTSSLHSSSMNTTDWIDSLQRLQAPAIAAQMEFQRLMADSHMAFLRAVEGSYGAVMPGAVASAPMVPPSLTIVLDPKATLSASAGPASPPTPVAAVTAPVAVPVAVPVAMQAAAPAPAAPTMIALQPLLLAIVADKTGYPAEMIDTDMDMEADLGIDSIKRVEILSAMRAQVPDLPQVATSKMAATRTLAQIMELFGGSVASGGNSAAAPVAAVAAVASATAPVVASRVLALQPILLAIVAEKTGYPAEMIDTEMDMEADLGIDSIKRVEILSAMRAQVPDLPQVATTKMAATRTLAQIIVLFGGPTDGSAAVVVSAPASVAVPAAALAVVSRVDELQPILLAIVAEKTGYPAEMIDTDMDMEADLGIDSIKRVEILSAMRTRVPDLPQVATTKMAATRTLAQIIELFGGVTDAGLTSAPNALSAPAAADSPDAHPPAALPPVARIAVRTRPAAALGFAVPSLRGAAQIVVTPDGGAVAQSVVQLLAARGVNAVEAPVTAIPATAGGVIFLGGLRNVAGDTAVAVNREAFHAARTVAAHFREHGGLFVTVQDTGGDFGLSGREAGRAWLGGVAALTKTARDEWPMATCKAIDVERAGRTDAAIADAIVSELFGGGPEVEVGLSGAGERITLASVPCAVSPAVAPLAPGAVFVVTGGARGVTAASLVALGRAAQPRLVILGRTALLDEPAVYGAATTEAALKRTAMEEAKKAGRAVSPKDIGAEVERMLAAREVRDTLAQLTATGAQVRYDAVDVRDPVALGALFADVRSTWGPIQGLVHGAGVLADAFIDKKTDAQFDRVFDTKVLGLQALLEATSTDPLRVICLFSSVAARGGNAGQSDYAMANEVLNKVAAVEARRREGQCRVVAIGWGPWDGGMVTPALRGHFVERGVALLPVAAGADAFVKELMAPTTDDVEIVIGGGDAGLHGGEAPGGSVLARMEITVTAASHPQLESHRIQGKPVLPVVMAVEWFARLARALFPERSSVQLRDVRVVRGIVLAGFDGPGDHFAILAIKGAKGVELELRDASNALRYAAIIEPSGIVAKAEPLNGAVLGESPWQATEIYSANTLFHGRDFQVIRTVDGVSPIGARATLASTADLAWPNDAWETDPAAIDGALQLAILCGIPAIGPTLPLRIGRIGYTGGVVTSPIHCALLVRSQSPERVVCDITLVGSDGATIADLVDVEMYAVPSGNTTNTVLTAANV